MDTPDATLPPTRQTRGSRTDGDVTRARIVEAAGQLFGEQGYAETTSKAIASKAGVDLASINYHFGTRDGLYKAVLAEAHRRLVSVAELERIAHAPEPAEARLRQLIELIISRAMSKRGWNAHVLARELLSPSSHLDVLFAEEMSPKFRFVAGLLSEITGIPLGDPSLIRCAISVGAPCAVLFVVGRIPTPLTTQLMELPQDLLVDHLHTFAIAGLEAIARKRTG